MGKGSARNWGLAILSAYVVFAVIAALLLAVSLVAPAGPPESHCLKMQHYSRVFLLAVLLFLALLLVGAVVAVAGATYLDWSSRQVRTLARWWRKPSRVGSAASAPAGPTDGSQPGRAGRRPQS